MENIKTFEVDGNELIADFESNKYFIIFKNYEGQEVKSEIPRDIFNTYLESKSIFKKNQNEQERHWEQIALSENEIFKRAFKHPDSIETIIIKEETNKELHVAISNLSIIQNKRIKKYYFENRNEMEIAEEEKTTQQAINCSLQLARETIKEKILKKFKKI